jgi:hypothetical protein
MTAGIVLAMVAALLLVGSATAGDSFTATTVTLTSKTAKGPIQDMICGGACDGGGGYAACGSAWVDKHYDTWTGSYGIHGSVSWCWNSSSVWNVSIPLSPWSNNRYEVTGYSQWGAGAECGGGAGAYSYASYRWEPLPQVWTNYNLDATTSVCPGGWGVIR